MALSEFALIQRYFAQRPLKNAHNVLGIGDDCALLEIPNGYQLAVTTDTMVENVHFFAGANPKQLGHKLLAVNLSDLASMGAQPFAVTLALTLPQVDEIWLENFAEGFFALAEQYQVDLIGGDTTKGQLSLTVQALGLIPKGFAMQRSAAQSGDFIYVTGNIGDAGLGLKIIQGYLCENPQAALTQLHTPQPQIAAGLHLRNLANACIDISDGLAADLTHILEKSQVGATLDFDLLPLSEMVKKYCAECGDWQMPFIAGDDYQLCFTISPEKIAQLQIPCWQIGIIEAQSGLRILKEGHLHTLEAHGFEHFS